MRRTVRQIATGGVAVALLVGVGACGGSGGDGVSSGPVTDEAVKGAQPETTRPAERVVTGEEVPSRPLMPPTKDFIAHLFNQWNVALASGDPQQVANRYAPDAVLIPAFSNEVRSGRAGIVEYFTEFLQSRPQSAIKQSSIQVLDPSTAVDTGVYVFLIQDRGSERQLEARYTFVYERRDDDRWLIVNHHSSLMPRQAATAANGPPEDDDRQRRQRR
jgi:uncharacterized protein (TIGR02246 family)